MASDEFILDQIRTSVGYRTTVGPTDKQKVDKALAGLPSTRPHSNLGRAAWELARRIASTPFPPPPPTAPLVAPRTYNTAPGGEPSARFCTTGLTRNANGRLFDAYSEYDDDGRSLGGRTEHPNGGGVPGLKPANEMDNQGPCDPYFNFPPWPVASYQK